MIRLLGETATFLNVNVAVSYEDGIKGKCTSCNLLTTITFPLWQQFKTSLLLLGLFVFFLFITLQDDPFKLKTGGMIDMKALKGKR